MLSCTFFGHRTTDEKIEPTLRSAIIRLICKGVDTFYVGNNGNFDLISSKVLENLSKEYPNIKYYIVYAYPNIRSGSNLENCIYPLILKRGLSPIPDRNKWMINRSDYVITNVTVSFGGAARFKKYAQRMEKNIIELSKM